MMILREPVGDIVIWILMCFGIFTPVAILVQRCAGNKTRAVVQELGDAAVILVRWAGIAYFFVWLAGLYATHQNAEDWRNLIHRIFGPYAAGYWIYLFAYIVAPQFLWIKWVRDLDGARVIVAIFILFVANLERITILITSLHRDYVPSSWAMFTFFPGFTVLIYGLKIIAFIALLFMIRSCRAKA